LTATKKLVYAKKVHAIVLIHFLENIAKLKAVKTIAVEMELVKMENVHAKKVGKKMIVPKEMLSTV